MDFGAMKMEGGKEPGTRRGKKKKLTGPIRGIVGLKKRGKKDSRPGAVTGGVIQTPEKRKKKKGITPPHPRVPGGEEEVE